MNNSYIIGYEFYRRMKGSQEDFFRRGGKYAIDTVPIHENKKQTLII